jgi:putative iron-only hydrogenase system regulator
METRIALIGIVVENKDSIRKLNDTLHEYGEYIVGRMGIPYPKRNISVISIVMDAPSDIISALSGKLGMIPHINIKTVYSKLSSTEDRNKH